VKDLLADVRGKVDLRLGIHFVQALRHELSPITELLFLAFHGASHVLYQIAFEL
jgi:hypothetical protein